MTAGDVVLVTGGSGFLGQHIVKHLQLKADDFTEIRVFDVKPYCNILGHNEPKPVRTIVGDIRILEDVLKAVDGVDCVIHTASLISISTFPDKEILQAINVKGTENVIEACIEHGVTRLVYTSTTEVVSSLKDISNGDESIPYPPSNQLIFPEYGGTKQKAEQLVLAANGTRTKKTGKNSRLNSISLRPPAMYGEGDQSYITNALRFANMCFGWFMQIGDGSAKMHPTYVGNVAWAHVLASVVLKTQPEKGGNAFFVTDETPPTNHSVFVKPHLKLRGFRMSRSVPFLFIYYIFVVMEFFLRLIRPYYEINLKTSTWRSIHYINETQTFNRSKIENVLGYKPLYDLDTSLKLSSEYYRHVKLN